MPELPADLAQSIQTALAEDIGSGDITAALIPAGQTLDRYLRENYSRTWGMIKSVFKLFFGKKIEKQKYKYFTGNRTQEVFERYKTYHLLVLRRDA